MGIPVVQIGSLISVAKVMGANRIVKGFGIPYPLGDPQLDRSQEKLLRKKIVEKGLDLLSKEINEQEVVMV